MFYLSYPVCHPLNQYDNSQSIVQSVNFLVDSLNELIECLGPLLTIRVIVPGNGEYDGTRTEISLLTKVEEYLRALSTNNYLNLISLILFVGALI